MFSDFDKHLTLGGLIQTVKYQMHAFIGQRSLLFCRIASGTISNWSRPLW
jgi:hypothetical protein